jgi:hypothetical protein
MLAFTAQDTIDLTDSLTRGLRDAVTAPHYDALDAAALAGRCRRLADTFVSALQGDAPLFVEYVRRITRERMAEGFYLPEIQQALSLLEAGAWRIVVDRSNVASLVRNLVVVTGVVGAAKDELARVFLEHSRTLSAAARVQTAPLFAGTESVVA